MCEIFKILVPPKGSGFRSYPKLSQKNNYGCSLEATLLATYYMSIRPGGLQLNLLELYVLVRVAWVAC